VPLDELPGWMQAIGESVPLTHGIMAARRVADGETIGDVAGLLRTELVIGVVYTFLGYQLLRFLEHSSRKHASFQVA
jgi:ABC-2 type transport system permease protein